MNLYGFDPILNKSNNGAFKFAGRGKKIKMKLSTLITLIIVLVCNVGCLSSMALNSVGAAAGGAPVSFENSGGGKGESFWIASYDDVIAASLRAGEALSLETKEKQIEKDQAFFRFYDAKKERIDLFIERRSDTVTSIKFDVGWFGSVAFGRLMARQIISELIESESFLEDWTHKINN